MVQGRFGMLGNMIVGGEIQGVPMPAQDLLATELAENAPRYFFFSTTEKFWDNRMNNMVNKNILDELVRIYGHTRHVDV